MAGLREHPAAGNEGLTFTVVDVETANADCAMICQIGIVHVADGKIADEWETLVDPETSDWRHTSIHGIEADDAAGSPKIPAIEGELRRRLRGNVVSHSSFDRAALNRAMSRYGLRGLDAPRTIWHDSVRIARRAWPELAGAGGYKLKNVARFLNIEFNHHDALEDARAAAHIVIAAGGLTAVRFP